MLPESFFGIERHLGGFVIKEYACQRMHCVIISFLSVPQLIHGSPLPHTHNKTCLNATHSKILIRSSALISARSNIRSRAGKGKLRLEFLAKEKLVGAIPSCVASSAAVHSCFLSANEITLSMGDGVGNFYVVKAINYRDTNIITFDIFEIFHGHSQFEQKMNEIPSKGANKERYHRDRRQRPKILINIDNTQ